MKNERNEYGYSTEDHIAWQGAHEKTLPEGWDYDPDGKVHEPEEFFGMESGRAQLRDDPDGKVYEPEEFFGMESGSGNVFGNDNEFKLSILRAQEEERRKERARLDKYEDHANERARERAEADAYNKKLPWVKLREALAYYGGYLAKSKNPADVELSDRIFVALSSGNNKDFSSLENLFVELKEKAKTDQDLAYAVPEWEKYYNQFIQSYKASEKNKFEQKKEEYKKSNFFARAISKLMGNKTKSNEEGKKR